MSKPLGVVLAGGAGRRIGGAKATVKLAGRPLIAYPLEALWRALGAVAVVAKPDTELPCLPGVRVWLEPPRPRHPLVGIVHALERARGRPVLVCALDLPLVSEDLVRALATASRGAAPAVVVRADGRVHPTLGCYAAASLEPLRAALRVGQRPLRDTVAELRPRELEVADAEALFNVNTPEELLEAGELLRRRVNRT